MQKLRMSFLRDTQKTQEDSMLLINADSTSKIFHVILYPVNII